MDIENTNILQCSVVEESEVVVKSRVFTSETIVKQKPTFPVAFLESQKKQKLDTYRCEGCCIQVEMRLKQCPVCEMENENYAGNSMEMQVQDKQECTQNTAALEMETIERDTRNTDKMDTFGYVATCGAMDFGQLGFESIAGAEPLNKELSAENDMEELDEVKVPSRIVSMKGVKLSQIQCGAMHTLAVDHLGKNVYSWGCNDDFVLGRKVDENKNGEGEPRKVISFGGKVQKVSCGDCHSAGLNGDGECFTWGTYKDESGYLGYDEDTKFRMQPDIVEFKVRAKVIDSKIVDIASGDHHTLAVDSSGSVYAWGAGTQGQLGRKVMPRQKKNNLKPLVVKLPKYLRSKVLAKNVFAGGYHSFVTTKCNGVYAFGLNNFGQLGIGQNENSIQPMRLSFFDDQKIVIQKLAAGLHHSIALAEDGTVYAFGRADSGQLGLPIDIDAERLVRSPTLIQGLENIKSVACGSNHTFFITKTGTVYACGYGELHQLGIGKDIVCKVPTIVGMENQTIHADGGAQFSAFITSNC